MSRRTHKVTRSKRPNHGRSSVDGARRHQHRSDKSATYQTPADPNSTLSEWGISPSHTTVDRGADFCSSHFLATTKLFLTVNAGGRSRSPTLKPIVERYFHDCSVTFDLAPKELGQDRCWDGEE